MEQTVPAIVDLHTDPTIVVDLSLQVVVFDFVIVEVCEPEAHIFLALHDLSRNQ